MKKRQLILAIFIIVIMISSAIGFVYTNDSNDANTINYNGFKFKLTENYNYIVDIQGKQFIFDKSQVEGLTTHTVETYADYKDNPTKYRYIIPLRTGPKEVEKFIVDKNINNYLLNKKYIYIAMDPEYSSKAVLASLDLAKVLGTAEYSVFKIPTEGALTYSISNATNSTFQNTPIITCNDVNNDIGVIWFNIDNENKIYSNKGCVIIEAVDEDILIKLADRLVYSLLGIM